MKSLRMVVVLAAVSMAFPALAGEPPQEAVAIRFAVAAGTVPITCRSSPVALGGNAVLSRLRDARFYVSELALINRDGESVPLHLVRNDWQYAGVALLDFEDGGGSCSGGSTAMNDVVTGRVAAGDYVGLRFTVGVPVSGQDEAGHTVLLNHSSFEQAPPPLDIAAMSWNWQAGRKFMKVELLPEGGIRRPGGGAKVWTLHLGSTGCVGNPASGEIVSCRSPNRFPVVLPAFDPTRQRVVLDLAELLAASRLDEDQGGASGCMSSASDPECVPLFRQLGLNLREPPLGQADGKGTAVFRVEALQ